jgi:hypothetical protein
MEISIPCRWNPLYTGMGRRNFEQGYLALSKNREFENILGLLLIFHEEGLVD